MKNLTQQLTNFMSPKFKPIHNLLLAVIILLPVYLVFSCLCFQTADTTCSLTGLCNPANLGIVVTVYIITGIPVLILGILRMFIKNSRNSK